MGQYKYGMYVKVIANIKQDIKSLKYDDDAIRKKYNISKGQLGFIHDTLLKGWYKNLSERLDMVSEKIDIVGDPMIGSIVYCNYPNFGTGEVKRKYKDSQLMEVKFTNRPYSTMCNYEKMITVHDNIKRKLIVIKI